MDKPTTGFDPASARALQGAGFALVVFGLIGLTGVQSHTKSGDETEWQNKHDASTVAAEGPHPFNRDDEIHGGPFLGSPIIPAEVGHGQAEKSTHAGVFYSCDGSPPRPIGARDVFTVTTGGYRTVGATQYGFGKRRLPSGFVMPVGVQDRGLLVISDLPASTPDEYRHTLADVCR